MVQCQHQVKWRPEAVGGKQHSFRTFDFRGPRIIFVGLYWMLEEGHYPVPVFCWIYLSLEDSLVKFPFSQCELHSIEPVPVQSFKPHFLSPRTIEITYTEAALVKNIVPLFLDTPIKQSRCSSPSPFLPSSSELRKFTKNLTQLPSHAPIRPRLNPIRSVADMHYSCTCHNGDSYNWRITQPACESYAQSDPAVSAPVQAPFPLPSFSSPKPSFFWGRTATNSNNAQDVTYVTDTGRCTSSSGSLLDGDRWEAACQKLAVAGFACADGQGTCYAEADSVKGSCD